MYLITIIKPAHFSSTYRICISCLINMHEQLPSGVIDLNISMSLQLHPFFVYASIEGSGESVQMCRLN